MVHQFTTFTTPPNMQRAVAMGLSKGDAYYRELVRSLEQKRDRLAAGLEGLGYRVAPCQGTYFIVADISGKTSEADAEYCKRLTFEARVATVPLSAFYANDGPTNFIRFCFAKRDEVLDEAVARLAKFHRGAAA